MKVMMNILIIAIAASAVAQNPSTVLANTKNQLAGAKAAPSSATSAVKPGLKPPTALPAPSAKTAASSAPTQAAATAMKKTATTAKATGAVQKVAATKKKNVSSEVKQAEKPTNRVASKAKPSADGRRDPFVSPVVERKAESSSGCSTGKKCLIADQIALKGIVKTLGANIAVFVTADNRAYFLHENDPIYNGVVTKISAESVTIREQVKDVLGRPATREVVKRINTPA